MKKPLLGEMRTSELGLIQAYDGTKWVIVHDNANTAKQAIMKEMLEGYAKSRATLNREDILKQMILQAYEGDNFEIVKQCKKFGV